MGFILPVNTIFITKNLRKSMVTAGFVLLIYSLLMLVGNFLGGQLFDRWSHRGTLLLGYGLSAASLCAITFNHTWPSYFIFLATGGLAMGIAYTGINSYTALLAEQSPRKSQTIFSRMYLAANVGIAVGSTFVGWIFQRSVFWTFALQTICFLSCFLIVLRLGAILESPAAKATADQPPFSSAPFLKLTRPQRIRNLILVASASLIIWSGYSQWDSNLSLYMLQNHFSLAQYSFLFSINAASLFIIQPLMNRLLGHFLTQLKSQITVGLLLMGSSFLLLPTATNYSQYIGSMLLLTIGESVTFPLIPALLNKFAQHENRGTYQSFYVIFSSLGRALGPYWGSLLITKASFTTLFYVIWVTMFLAAWGIGQVREKPAPDLN
ncbi:MFS transporter [Lactobacillus sp. DCY120]|uniref:MFS transporter n=2 Tax=Bombilactobacillus apium TaxID=2675299 RepID=A0A850RCZ9_9LACO|nr:MFS transporter [Bombilactobacillus apium]